MGDLESEAASLLIPMLHNEEVALRPEEQRIVARWATLKLLVAQEAHPKMQRSISHDRYRSFYADRSLPIGAQVWLARYNGEGSWPTAYQYRELFVSMEGAAEPARPNAYLAGFSIGYLAFLYWGHEINRGPMADISQVESHLTQVWPATGVAKWPPAEPLNADGLRFVLDHISVEGWV